MAIELKQVIPWGRSFEEYRRMFDLSPQFIRGRILGCGDGPASFNAEATARGHSVVSCDPIYAFEPEQIRQRFDDCYDDLIKQVRQQKDGFVWTDFADPDDLGRSRRRALETFLGDFNSSRATGRYVAAALPELPFTDGQFDLALVSHFMFLYSAHVDLAFHIASLDELLRVAGEVRIFPLLTLARARSPFVEPLMEHAAKSLGCRVTIQKVDYEFQKGGNEMIRFEKRS